MKKIALIGMFAAATAMMTGCGVFPSKGAVTAAIMIDSVSSGDYVDNSVKASKTGTATVKGIVLFTEGDASIGAAMKDAGITKVNRVDYKITNILFLYTSRTTIVYGE